MPSISHGTLPAPGVWDGLGFAQRHARNRKIGAEGVGIVSEAGAQPTSNGQTGGGDWVHNNSFYSNGATGEASSTARLVHLDMTLVPRAPPPGPAPQRSPTVSPAKRVSGIIFDDGSGSAGGGGSPQRVCVDGAWRLNLGTSGSSPSLPKAEMGKRFVPLEQHNGRRLQLDNRTLMEHRVGSLKQHQLAVKQEDLNALGAWGQRWGFQGSPSDLDSPTRRRANPSAMMPTLAGFQVPPAL